MKKATRRTKPIIKSKRGRANYTPVRPWVIGHFPLTVNLPPSPGQLLSPLFATPVKRFCGQTVVGHLPLSFGQLLPSIYNPGY